MWISSLDLEHETRRRAPGRPKLVEKAHVRDSSAIRSTSTRAIGRGPRIVEQRTPFFVARREVLAGPLALEPRCSGQCDVAEQYFATVSSPCTHRHEVLAGKCKSSKKTS